MCPAPPERHAALLRWSLSLPAVLALAAALAAGPAAEARPKSTLKITYYTISGSNEHSLDEQMARLGPSHRGGKAYATLSVNPTFKGRLTEGKYCGLRNFAVNAKFVMTLPRLAPGTRLSKATKSRWRSFAAFVRRHEERHRDIWLSCLARAEARALEQRIGNCRQLDAMVDNIFKEEWAHCEQRHDAFDASEQARLKKQPLIVAAKSSKRRVALTGSARRQAPAIGFRGGRASQ
jgi:predicted secreted Zn-dependent protease